MGLKGKEFYKKMLAAKKAKKDKVKRTEEKPTDKAPEVRPEIPDTPVTPKRVDVTSQVSASSTEEHISVASALNKAIQRIEQQAKGI